MANLIVTVIAIALVAVASLMGAYYGGSAFLRGTSRANAATLVNQGSQIGAAAILYANDEGGDFTTDLADTLVSAYITEVPATPGAVGAGTWEIRQDGTNQYFAKLTLSSETVCLRVTEDAGDPSIDVIPAFDDDTLYGTLSADRFNCFELNGSDPSEFV
ncbi:MAG: hypothetical protein U9N14_01810, partial [Pseudomonadota bacterium]|nr:hypothetical protein [Pseudomonadota bacterium]